MKTRDNGRIYYDAAQPKSEKQVLREVAWKSIFHWIYAIVFVVIAFIIFSFFFKVYRISGDSMKPTFNDGNIVIVSTECDVTYSAGDIVLAEIEDEVHPIVKRIVATENQTVEINYQTQQLIVDGVVIEEDYISEMSFAPLNEISYPYTVPEGHVFILGDNRIDSRDSRNIHIRAIPTESIIGKVSARILPITEFRIISGDQDA